MYEILGYASSWAVSPGDTIEFKVSCDGVERYDVDLVKIRCGDAAPGAPGLKERVVASPLAGPVAGRKQETYVGTYALIDPYPETHATARSWVLGLMPTLPGNGAWQTVFGRWDAELQRGFKLSLNPAGCLVWTESDGQHPWSVELGTPMVARQWYVVSICLDHAAREARIKQSPVTPLHARNTGASANARMAQGGPVDVGDIPLVMGAHLRARGAKNEVLHAFNGRIDSLVLLPCLATDDDARQILRCTDARRYGVAPLMEWDFSKGIDSDRIEDAAAPSRNGTLFNLPARAVPGIRWDATAMAWTHKPDHYAAIHFHDDGLGDAQWETDFSYRVPDDLESGLYAARCSSGEVTERIVFIVSPKPGVRRRKIAFLASTATYMAYSNSHYRLDEAGMEMKSGSFAVVQPWERYLGEHRELGLSMYDTHSDGYGVYYSTRLRPMFSMHLLGRAWALNGDTHLIDWLEAKNFDFDVINDDQLHREGLTALEGYKVIMTGAHPEYWTTPMWDAMVYYQAQGGRLMYMGGNGFYWRCAYHPKKPWVMELRRAETGARYWETPAGESYHSFTGEYGGTWRRIGRAPQTLVGLGTAATGFDASSYYRRTPESRDPRASFIFEGIEEEIIGNFGSSGGGAAGDEIDRADIRLGTPPHTLVLARSEGHTRYYSLVPEEIMYSHPTVNGQEAENCRADLIFYECLNGGAVFSTGSITWGASLAHQGYENNVSKITENVLRRFSDDAAFDFPTGTPEEMVEAKKER